MATRCWVSRSHGSYVYVSPGTFKHLQLTSSRINLKRGVHPNPFEPCYGNKRMNLTASIYLCAAVCFTAVLLVLRCLQQVSVSVISMTRFAVLFHACARACVRACLCVCGGGGGLLVCMLQLVWLLGTSAR